VFETKSFLENKNINLINKFGGKYFTLTYESIFLNYNEIFNQKIFKSPIDINLIFSICSTHSKKNNLEKKTFDLVKNSKEKINLYIRKSKNLIEDALIETIAKSKINVIIYDNNKKDADKNLELFLCLLNGQICVHNNYRFIEIFGKEYMIFYIDDINNINNKIKLLLNNYKKNETIKLLQKEIKNEMNYIKEWEKILSIVIK
jgi:hypothetical protein